MCYLFQGCESLTTLDLNHFETVNVISMNSMFEGCNNLEIIIGKKDERIKADYHTEIECDNDTEYLFSNLITGQLIALETALKLKRNVDNPKGLHKVVVDKSI